MLNRAIWIGHFFCFNVLLPAQDNEFRKVDSIAGSISHTVNGLNDFDSLIKIYNNRFSKECEKVRAVYFWVTENIAYDGEGLYSGNMISGKEPALKMKRSVCAGYAKLLDHAFQKFGLESKYVTGQARLLDERSQWNPDAWFNGHAWNAVKVDNDWKLIDATWASGYLSGKDFTKRRDDFWFFTPPDAFLLSHFPSDSTFQLVTNVITQKQFHDQPFWLPDFHKSGIRKIFPLRLIIKDRPGKVIPIRFTGDKQFNIAILRDEWGSVVGVFPVYKEDEKYTFYYQVTNSIQGKLYLGVAYRDEKKRIIWKAEFVLAYLFSTTDEINYQSN